MKIANIILTSQNGGAEQVFLDYIAAQKNLGHEVLAITKDDAPYANKTLELNCKLEKIKNNCGDYDFFASKKIKKILEEFKIEAVFAHVGRSVVLTRRAIKSMQKKPLLIAVNHSMNVKRSIGADLIISVNLPIFYRTIDLGQSQERSIVVPNALDLKNSSQIETPNLKKTKITLGVIGRFDHAKGFDLAILAIKNLRKISEEKNLNIDFNLVIAGGGEEEKNLTNLVAKLELEKNVKFLGWVKEKSQFFEQIDIFCMSSRKETFGLVTLEAMKFGKPIISTDNDGSKEILRPEIDGIFVSLDAEESLPNQIAQAALRLIFEQELAKKITQNAFARLQEKFSSKALEERMKEIVGTAKQTEAAKF